MNDNWQETFERLLPQVERPIRYTDAELHSVKSKVVAKVKVALVFPDTYEIGMSNYGLRVLYHIINGIPGAAAERAFLPWMDMLEKMKTRGIPLATLESLTPLGEFDMVGISLQSELGYTNALAVLELAGIPLRSEHRKEGDPIVVAGGPCTVNPLPLWPFFDAFLVGDGEDAIREITDVFLQASSRKERLDGLGKIEGLWLPAFHGRSKTVNRRVVEALRAEDAPVDQIVPIGEVEHDRMVVEIGRGCLRGCRFCQAGFANRPSRHRPIEEVVGLAEKGIAATGWEEVSLLSFAVSDYPYLDALLEELNSRLSLTRTAISLPSFRGEAFNERIGKRLKEIKKTGLTFAPETASPKLKKVINKNVSNEEIIETVKTAARLGWRRVKLYFMIGLPGEMPEDIDMDIEFIRDLARQANGLTVNVHLSAFVPKPHTPMQWTAFEALGLLEEKLNRIKEEAGVRRVKIKWANPKASFIEAVLARGDEKLASVLEEVLQRGGYFQEWSEHFNFNNWLEAFAKQGIEPLQYTRVKDTSEELGWDFINTRVGKGFLRQEYENALDARTLKDCMSGPCYACGMECEPQPAVSNEGGNLTLPGEEKSPLDKRTRTVQQPSEIQYRLKLEVGEVLRYASHLDLVRAIYRMLRRSGLPLVYTEGFSPHPRVRFGFPKPVGVTSKAEYVDIVLTTRPSGDLLKLLAPYMPEGLTLLAAKLLPPNTPAVTKAANLIHYEIDPVPSAAEGELELRARQEKTVYRADTTNGRLSLILEDPQRAKLWDVLAYLYNFTPGDARALSAERIDVYVRKGTRIITPLEENYR